MFMKKWQLINATLVQEPFIIAKVIKNMFVRKIAHEGDFAIDSTCMTFDQICVIIASIKIENKTIKSDYVEKKG